MLEKTDFARSIQRVNSCSIIKLQQLSDQSLCGWNRFSFRYLAVDRKILLDVIMRRLDGLMGNNIYNSRY